MNAKGKEKGWVLTPGGLQVQGRGTEAPPGLRISSSKGCLLPLVLPSELPPHQGVPQALLGTGTPGRRMLGEVVLNAPPPYLLVQHLPKPRAEGGERRGELFPNYENKRQSLTRRGNP